MLPNIKLFLSCYFIFYRYLIPRYFKNYQFFNSRWLDRQICSKHVLHCLCLHTGIGTKFCPKILHTGLKLILLGDDDSPLMYAPGTMVIHKWAAFGTFDERIISFFNQFTNASEKQNQILLVQGYLTSLHFFIALIFEINSIFQVVYIITRINWCRWSKKKTEKSYVVIRLVITFSQKFHKHHSFLWFPLRASFHFLFFFKPYINKL